VPSSEKTPGITKPEGYYKTFFIQKGVGAAAHNCPPVMSDLDKMHALGYEYFDDTGLGTEAEAVAVQAKCLVGEPGLDDNGRLLYPDGAPRFAVMFVNGGDAGKQARSLGEAGRARFREFYNGGGSVMGSCAGGWILGTKNWKETEATGIWPGEPNWAQLGENKQLDLKLSGDCPLLKYDDFGGDLMISTVRYNKGPYWDDSADSIKAKRWVPGTEVIARYFAKDEELLEKMKEKKRLDMVETLAWKRSESTGRAILCGAHPEGAKDPKSESYRYFNALIRYAFEGRGLPRVKAELKSGETRDMTNNELAGHEKIGDLQYHHFTINVPANAKELTISLAGAAKENGDTQYNLDLHMKKGGYAFLSGAPHKSTGSGANEKITISNPEAGTWYAAVVCKDTVTAEAANVFVYKGKTGVLNGVAYSIRVDIH